MSEGFVESTGTVAVAEEEEPRWRKYTNIAFVILAIIIGAAILPQKYYTKDLVQDTFGQMIFSTGFTPFVISLWAMIMSFGLRRGQDMYKMLLSLVLVVVGYVTIVRNSTVETGKHSEEIILQISGSLLTVGFLYFVSKFFFLIEDDERHIQRLEEALEEALASPSYGLALSYYYNFILPVSYNLERKDGSGSQKNTRVQLEYPQRRLVDYGMLPEESFLWVLIPRDLNDVDIKAAISQGTSSGQCMSGKVLERHGTDDDPDRPVSHRPMFVTFLNWTPEAAAAAAGGSEPTASPSQNRCAGLFDIPTIISSIRERRQAEHKAHLKEREEAVLKHQQSVGNVNKMVSKVRLTVKFLKELAFPPLRIVRTRTVADDIVEFHDRLWHLCQESTITRGKVRLILMPPFPLDWAGLKAYIAAAAATEPPKDQVKGDEGGEGEAAKEKEKDIEMTKI